MVTGDKLASGKMQNTPVEQVQQLQNNGCS